MHTTPPARKERPGFVSMELIKGRGKHRRPFLLSHPSAMTFLWDCGSSLKAIAWWTRIFLRRAGQAGSLGREQSPWWILQALGVCRFRDSFSSPQGLCFGSRGTHISWLGRSGYVNQIHVVTLQWEAALSTGRLVLVWQSHLLPVGGLIKVCQNTWKLWTNP